MMIAWTKAKARIDEVYFERNVDRIENDWWVLWEKKRLKEDSLFL